MALRWARTGMRNLQPATAGSISSYVTDREGKVGKAALRELESGFRSYGSPVASGAGA